MLCISAFMPFSCCRFYVSSNDVISDRFQDRKEKVAPIFKHGEGRNVVQRFKRIIFCHEKKGRRIIIEELKKAGIVIDYEDVRIDEINVKRKRDCCAAPMSTFTECDKWLLDGYCSENNIGFEFLSKKEHFYFGIPYLSGKNIPETFIVGGYGTYDIKYCAVKLRRIFQEFGQITIAVFYDPLGSVPRGTRCGGKDYFAINDSVETQVEEKIIAQVHDFIDWLRLEGIIESVEEGEKEEDNLY